jgi:hypothetical protein
LNITGTAGTTASGLMAKGREAASAALQKTRDAGRKARLDKFTREARDDVREMPVYKARSDMRRTPLDMETVLVNYGDDTAKSLQKALPGSLKKEGGVDPEIFAAEHGFASAADMISQVLKAKRRGDAVADVVRRKEAGRDANYDAFESLMETREVAIQMELVGRKSSRRRMRDGLDNVYNLCRLPDALRRLPYSAALKPPGIFTVKGPSFQGAFFVLRQGFHRLLQTACPPEAGFCPAPLLPASPDQLHANLPNVRAQERKETMRRTGNAC